METILIVDDTPMNVTLLERILENEGFGVLSCPDGHTALEIVDAERPDLILLDIQMPGMDGFEVCERLKGNEGTRDIPIMFISAINNTEGIVKALSLGGADYITKPFQINEVVARVYSQLTMVRQARQIEALRQRERLHYESLQKMKEQFVAQATHDLKNPLNVIMGYVYLMQNTPVEPVNAGSFFDWLEEISRNVEKMRLLVGDILDLSQMHTGIELETMPVNLAAFLQEAVTDYVHLAAEKQIDLQYDPPADDLVIDIDEGRMSRVMDNLISNAIKYTPEQGQVKVYVESFHDQTVISVADSGLGIPQEDLPRLFDAFFRVGLDAHREQVGTGLGLSVVKAIVEQHNGRIEVESVLGEGSVFRVKLPPTTVIA